MAIDFLDGVKAEREEQRKRYLRAFREALKLSGLNASEKAEFDRLEKAVDTLVTKSNKKEAEIQPLASEDHDEYVSEMVELCDQEAKTFVQITADLNKLVRAVRVRHASMSLSNIKDD
jgi:hypothetical protein